jgi:YVTN family beta-propeller protein
MKVNVRNCCFAIALTMSAASIEGPHLGLVFDASHKALRPILGIPGAAILGQPLDLGVELHKTAVSPRQDFALATEGEHNRVVVLIIGRKAVTPVLGVEQNPDQILLSPAGRAAALYYKNTGTLLILTGLPGAPKVSEELYLSAGRPHSALAVGDDGRTVLAGVGSTVFMVTGSGEVPVLPELLKVAAITIPVHGTAYVADSGRNQIYRLRGLGGNLETDILAGPKQGIGSPVALAVSPDGGRAFVVNGKSRTVSIIDLRGHAPVAKVACGCAPTGLDRLIGNDVFRLTEPSDRPLWMLDASARVPRVLFVPGDLARSSQK